MGRMKPRSSVISRVSVHFDGMKDISESSSPPEILADCTAQDIVEESRGT